MSEGSTRDNFDSKVVEALAKRASYICSNPECRCLTIAATKLDDEKFTYIGVAAHITAASKGGPRYDSSLTSEERSSINNGIFLCGSCSIMVDKNKGLDYSVEQLNDWKKQHENWVQENLNKKISNQAQTIINVSSENQSGGITAGIVNIQHSSNYKSPSEELKFQLSKQLESLNKSIQVKFPELLLRLNLATQKE